MDTNYNSFSVIDAAVEQIAKLPGIGRRTALRLVLFILKQDVSFASELSRVIVNLKQHIKYCQKCHYVSDKEVCDICSNNHRDKSVICVVQDISDVMAIENTQQYRGLYHVLGGIISPIDGIGPQDLKIDTLVERIKHNEVNEIILALNTTVEGDTTAFYIFRKVQDLSVKVSVIARGVAVGDHIEYADEITLGRSIVNRVPYEHFLK